MGSKKVLRDFFEACDKWLNSSSEENLQDFIQKYRRLKQTEASVAHNQAREELWSKLGLIPRNGTSVPIMDEVLELSTIIGRDMAQYLPTWLLESRINILQSLANRYRSLSKDDIAEDLENMILELYND